MKTKAAIRPGFQDLCDHLTKQWEGLDSVARCENVKRLYQSSGLSERNLAKCLKLSKSEIHRMIAVARLPDHVKEVCSAFGTDYHVLCVLASAPPSQKLRELENEVYCGRIRRHQDAVRFLGVWARRQRTQPHVVMDFREGEVRCTTCKATKALSAFSKEVRTFTHEVRSWSGKHAKCAQGAF